MTITAITAITAITREAGVTPPALIHNRYPDIADDVRRVGGKARIFQRQRLQAALDAERQKTKGLRLELETISVNRSAPWHR